jgi:hypothetical protein
MRAHYRTALVSQHGGFPFVNFVILEFFILTFLRRLGRSVPGLECWTLVCCFISHPEDDISVSKHAGVENCHELYFMLCILLHFLVNTLKLKMSFKDTTWSLEKD